MTIFPYLLPYALLNDWRYLDRKTTLVKQLPMAVANVSNEI